MLSAYSTLVATLGSYEKTNFGRLSFQCLRGSPMLEGWLHTGRVAQDQSKEGNEGPSVHGLTTLSDISLLEVKLENRYQAPWDLSIHSVTHASPGMSTFTVLDINLNSFRDTIIVVQTSPSRTPGRFYLLSGKCGFFKQYSFNPCLQPHYPSLQFLCLGIFLLPKVECFSLPKPNWK